MGYCGALITLAFLTAQDVEEKRISVKKLMIFAAAACVYFFFTEGDRWQEFGSRILPGLGLLLLSLVSRESIGFGDGAVVVVLGVWTNMFFTLTALSAGILAAGVFGLICLIRRQKEPFAFLPFLLFGTEVALVGI